MGREPHPLALEQSIGGVRIRYEETGSGFPLLLIAGGGWLFALAFSESILWGLGTLLFWPAVPIAFALTPTFMPFQAKLSGILEALDQPRHQLPNLDEIAEGITTDSRAVA